LDSTFQSNACLLDRTAAKSPDTRFIRTVKMRYFTIFIAVAAASVEAQKAQCHNTTSTELTKARDPFVQFAPEKSTFPCDMGAPIPFGKVPSGCAKLEIIVARGTSEPGDLGMTVGDPLVARIKRDLAGENVRGYPVQYPASRTGLDIGVADVQKRLEQQVKDCPDEKFALAGYSQGGRVITLATANLSTELTQKVVAVLLYGAGNGSAIQGPMENLTLANCAPGDFACPDAGSGAGHVSYNDQGTIWHDRSSKYVVAAFTGKSLGKKLIRSPTDSL